MRRWRRSGFAVATAVSAVVCALVAIAGFVGVAAASSDAVSVVDGDPVSSSVAPSGGSDPVPPCGFVPGGSLRQ